MSTNHPPHPASGSQGAIGGPNPLSVSQTSDPSSSSNNTNPTIASTSTSTNDAHPTDPSSPSLPWAFTDCAIDTLVVLISHMLDLLIQHNDQVVLTPDALTRFHSRAAPGISVVEYLKRIVKYTNMEKIPLLSLLAYIDITCQHLTTFTLSSLTVHRFLIAGVCAGSKAQCDVFCTNAHYAKVGGIKTQELNALEREFLKVTQWNLCCNADLLQRYYTSLIRSHGGYTQAAAPSISPFLTFPRSVSQSPQDPGNNDGGEGGDDRAEEIVSEGYGQAVYSQAVDSQGMEGAAISDNVDMVVDETRNGDPRPARKSRYSLNSDKQMDMDVDDVHMSSGVRNSPYSKTSVPSSSRSSIRGVQVERVGASSERSLKGRTSPLSYSDAKLAEPRIDTAHAAGQDASQGQAAHYGQVKGQGRGHWTDGQSHHDEQGNQGDHDHDGDQNGEEIPQELHSGQADHGQAGHGGHSLRSIVGGIFHRKTHHGDKQSQSVDHQPSQHQSQLPAHPQQHHSPQQHTHAKAPLGRMSTLLPNRNSRTSTLSQSSIPTPPAAAAQPAQQSQSSLPSQPVDATPPPAPRPQPISTPVPNSTPSSATSLIHLTTPQTQPSRPSHNPEAPQEQQVKQPQPTLPTSGDQTLPTRVRSPHKSPELKVSPSVTPRVRSRDEVSLEGMAATSWLDR